MTTPEDLRADRDGVPGVRGATIITRSGLYFDFANPTVDMIHLEDIAWGLARTCRFGGQMRGDTPIYSVAQHSVLVSRVLWDVREMVAHDWEGAKIGLLHDAAEAYIGDMVGPLKRLLPQFKEIELRIEAVIAQRFSIEFPWPPRIKAADLRLLRTEQRDFTAAEGDLWTGLDDIQPLELPILAWDVPTAAAQWLSEARFLSIA